MSEKRKRKNDKMTGIVGDRKIADGKDEDFHDRISSFIDELSSDEMNGEAAEESAHDQAKSGKSEIERGVAEVFNRFADDSRSGEKPRESIVPALDIDIQFEGEDAASESKQGDIEHGVSEVFDKYDAAPLIDGKQQEIIETPVNIEITDGDKDDTTEGKHKFSGIIYVAVGIFFVLLALIGVKLFKPADEFDKNFPAKTVAPYKIDRPSKSILTPKVMPLKTEGRKKSETNIFENTDPSGKAPEGTEKISKIGVAEDVKDEIRAFLVKWKTAWENTAGNQGDTDTYMSFYSDGFETNGLDKAGWMREKARTNRRKQWIRITLADVQLAEAAPDGRVRVNFLQDYRSSNFSEKSKKSLLLRKEEAGWMIVGAEDSTGDDDSTSSERTAQPVLISNGQQHTHPYTIHVASYRDKDVSNRAVEALRTDGFLAFSSCAEIPGKGIWYRIFIDYYETFEAAREAALKLKHKETVYANTVEKPYAIQIGIYDSESELKKMESDLRVKGYTPYRVPDEAHKGRTKLCIGAYDSIKDAAAEKQNLQNEYFPTIVVRR